jgi:hypothetical protein
VQQKADISKSVQVLDNQIMLKQQEQQHLLQEIENLTTHIGHRQGGGFMTSYSLIAKAKPSLFIEIEKYREYIQEQHDRDYPELLLYEKALGLQVIPLRRMTFD